MKNYTVKIPLAGHVVVFVSAENEKEAVEAAMMKAGEVEVDSRTLTNNDVEEFQWELYNKLSQGNVRNYWCNEVEVNEDDSFNDDEENTEEQ